GGAPPADRRGVTVSRVTPSQLRQMKERGEKIAMLTAYDYPTARMIDEAGVPTILVGDTLGMVVLGHDSTIPVRLDDIIRHTAAVRRGAKRALIIADMPFMTYHVSVEEGLRNAARLVQEGGCHAVKLEGGRSVVELVRRPGPGDQRHPGPLPGLRAASCAPLRPRGGHRPLRRRRVPPGRAGRRLPRCRAQLPDGYRDPRRARGPRVAAAMQEAVTSAA